MKPLRSEEIEERLRSAPAEPPADLVEAIKAEIPGAEELFDEPSEPPRPSWTAWRWVAASTLIAVVGGVVGYRVLEDPPPLASPRADAPEAAELSVEVAPEPQRLDPSARLTPPSEPAEGEGKEKDHRKRALQRVAPELESAAEDRFDADLDDGAFAEPRSTVAGLGSVNQSPEPESPAASRELDEVRFFERESVAAEMPEVPEYRSSVDVRLESEASATSVPSRDAARSLRQKLQAAGRAAPSTGGTAEPNDQPYGDMFFRPVGIQPFVDTEEDRFSTFGIDVDTGSYTLARRYLEGGDLPPAEAIRVEEFVNYFDYGDPAPTRDEFSLSAEIGDAPYAPSSQYRLLRFNIRARELFADERKAATLIFVVDVSGSMAQDDRLEMVKDGLRMLLDQLSADDRVGLVVYGSRGRVLLEPTSRLDEIRRAVDRLVPEGSTNVEEGLLLAYRLADQWFRPGGINRLILCSDGVANVGRTGPESILERIGREARRGIELTTIGFGMGNYNDVLMEQLADQGDGAYAYVDNRREAERVFVENLTGLLQTVASDAKAQVEFDPTVVSRYRLLGYQNRDIADDRFRDNTVDAGEVGAGHSVTALYEVKLHDRAPRRGVVATLTLRYRSRELGTVVETEQPVRLNDRRRGGRSDSLRLAAVVAEFAEILGRVYYAREGDLDLVAGEARAIRRAYRDDERVTELATLIERAAALTADRTEDLEPEPKPQGEEPQ